MQKRVRILHLLAQKPGFTGSGIYLRSIVKIAESYNYKQAVICGVEIDEEVNFHQEIPPAVYPVRFSTKELPFKVAGMSDVMPYESTRYRDMTDEMQELWISAFKSRIEKAVNEFQPDIILSHHLWMLSALAKQLFPEIPLVIISHGTALRQKEFCSIIADRITPSLQKANLVLALNETQKSAIETAFNIHSEKISVNGNGYNEKLFYSSKRPRNKIPQLIYAGKISYAKGLQQLFTALKNLYDNGRKFELKVCGSGSGNEQKELTGYAKECGFKIRFCGNVSQQVLAEKFRNSDCFLLPSFYEGLPLVVIEALASGLNVIVNDLPGLRNWLGKEVCSSGMVKFVKMPRLHNVDIPIKRDIYSYIQRLEKTIDECINSKSPAVTSCLKQHTWNSVFRRIHQHIERLVAR